MPDAPGGAALLAQATRAKVLPVMLAPVAVGATLAWSHTERLSWGWFLVTLLGAAAMHLGANVVNDFFDEESGADEAARQDPASLATGTGLIASGVLSRGATMRLAAGLFAIGLACGIVLAAARGWLVLLLGATGFVLAVTYVAPPIRYGYRGRGLGEAGIFMAFGYLPLVGSYYVQTGDITPDAAWASLVPGILTTLVLFHHHFLHWQADARAGKMTPVAVLGPDRALVVSRVAIVAAYGILIGQCVAGLWPPGAAVAVLGAVPVAAAVARAKRDPILPNYLQLLGATLGSSILTQTVLLMSLIVRVVVR
ncbi:MAG TPA: prenyltransferase [Actinomycetota bacterium]|nr:prenyltransferase [Actinomycetota bacterium]